jgi:predicted RNA-binding protein with PIN domain
VTELKIIVDGMNVIGSRPDGWWRDRPGARRSLVASLHDLVSSGNEVTVVFDGKGKPEEIEEASSLGVEVVFAPGGPNAADHRIIELLEDATTRVPPSRLLVVTSDDALAGAVHALGVTTEGAGSFRTGLEY